MSKIEQKGPEWFLWHEKLVRYRDKETVFFEGLTEKWNAFVFYAKDLRFKTHELRIHEWDHSILQISFGEHKVWLEVPLLNYAGGAPRTLSPLHRRPVTIKPGDVFEIHILWNADGAKPKRRPPAKVTAIMGGKWGTTRLY